MSQSQIVDSHSLSSITVSRCAIKDVTKQIGKKMQVKNKGHGSSRTSHTCYVIDVCSTGSYLIVQFQKNQ